MTNSRYEIIDLIGNGDIGEVYLARDPRLNRDVAIKTSAAQFSARFEREAKAIAALSQPYGGKPQSATWQCRSFSRSVLSVLFAGKFK